MKADRESEHQRLLSPNGSQTGNEARRSHAWWLFTRQQQREPYSWSSFNFLPKMVVIRMELWADLSRISPIQLLPENQIKPASVDLMESLLCGQTDGPEDVQYIDVYRWIKKRICGALHHGLHFLLTLLVLLIVCINMRTVYM